LLRNSGSRFDIVDEDVKMIIHHKGVIYLFSEETRSCRTATASPASTTTAPTVSTNDMILVLDNGAAATSSPTETAVEINEDRDGESDEIFKEELTAFSVDLASLVVRNGEVQRNLLPSPLM
jgi:hypothetical protein